MLSCPLPEEQNTRGRRIYPPEESAIGFGIITLKEIPKVVIITHTHTHTHKCVNYLQY